MGLQQSQKKGGYEGYSTAIPFTKRAKRTLVIASICLLIGGVWIGRKGLAWMETKTVRGAEISLLNDRPLEALDQLDRTWRWALRGTKSKYDELSLTLSSIVSPKDALAGYKEYLDRGSKKWNEENVRRYQDLLLDSLNIAVKAQDWDYLKDTIKTFETYFPEMSNDSRLYAFQAWQKIHENEYGVAMELIKKSLDANPFETEALMLRSRFQANSASEIEKNQARTTLKKVARGSDVASLEATLLLLAGQDLLLYPGDWEFALKKLRFHPYESIHFSLQEPDFLRSLAAGLIYRDSELSEKYLGRLTATDAANAQDWVRYAYATQLNGKVEEAGALIAHVETLNANADLVLWLKGRQAYLEADWERSLELLVSGSKGALAQPFYEALMAFLDESDNDTISQGVRLQAAKALQNWTAANLDQWLLIRQKLWAWDATSHAAIIAECQAKASLKDAVLIAQFLLSVDESEAALALLDDKAVDPAEAFTVRLSALLDLKRYEDAKVLIAGIKRVDAFTIALAELQLVFETNEKIEMGKAWGDCWSFAEDEGLAGDGFIRMAQLAVKYDQTLLAEKAFARQFSKDPDKRGGNREVWVAYFQIALQNAETEKALKVAYFANDTFPEDPEVSFQIAYLNLLLQRGVLNAKDSLNSLIDSDPENAKYNYGMALALLRTEQSAKAADLIEGFDALADGNYSPLELIVEYACLVETKKMLEAVDFRGKLDLDALLPEEAAFVLKYEKRMKGVL